MSASSMALTPSGHLIFFYDDDSPMLSDAVAQRIERAFDKGTSAGLFHLATTELETSLSPTFAFWRGFSRRYLTLLCRDAGAGEGEPAAVPPPASADLAAFADTCPLMKGLEYLGPEVLERIWDALDRHTRNEVRQAGGDVTGYLKTRNPLWDMVGRVTFHLAENRKDNARPFAFLVTYTSRLSDAARPQYLPLGKAFADYSAAGDRRGLLALLTPLARAAEQSELIREMVDSGEIFHALAWTPLETHRFLKDIAVFESSGVMIRVPDWWRVHGGRPAHPQVSLMVGEKRIRGLGSEALLDFSVQLTLDGETLTDEERQRILAETSGLVLLRGKWVEVDREKLSDLLSFWDKMKKTDFAEGISFIEGMRLLAGAGIEAKEAPFSPDICREWMDVDAGHWLEPLLADMRSPEKIARTDPGEALKATLRPYQQVGVDWLWFLYRLGLGACLADDMGLGKTIQILALLVLIRERMNAESGPSPCGPALLVVPASLVANWKEEIRRFAPSLSVCFAHPSETAAPILGGMTDPAIRKAALDGTDLVITTYALVHRLSWLKEIPWNLLILDEAQSIKNPAARQTRAVKALPGKNRIALTGTPVENRLGDLWSLFDFLCPGLLGKQNTFSRYVKRIMDGRENPHAGLRALVRPYILRRLKTDRRIIADLPEKVEVKVYCPLTKTQAALYEQSVRELSRRLAETDGIRRRGLILSYLMRFKQICNHPSQWLGDGNYAAGTSGKFGRLEAICEEIAARQEKALIFTQFREMTAPLSEALTRVFRSSGLVLHGETPVGKRRELIDAFQRENGPPFFVLSLKAGGVGLNLTEASHVIHFDRWWNPAVENQATDRAYRIGQKKNVLVHKFVCRGTIEERIDALIEGKKELAEGILGAGGEKLLTEMADEELIRFVSLDLSRSLADENDEDGGKTRRKRK